MLNFINVGEKFSMTNSNEQHNLIKSAQKETLSEFADAKPSEVIEVHWINVKNEAGNYPKTTDKIGKWLIFVPVESIDSFWAEIKKATEEGKLGQASKVATAKSNPNTIDPKRRVVCVYTYDWTDETDVRRVREELRKLGVTNKIAYKSDEDTLKGKYNATGHKRISKYYE